MVRRNNGLGDDRLTDDGFDVLDPRLNDFDVFEPEFPDNGSLKRNPLCSGFYRYKPPVWIENCDGKSGEASPRAEVCKAIKVGKNVEERDRVENKPSRDGIGPSMSGEVHLGRPIGQEDRELGELARAGIAWVEAQSLEAFSESCSRGLEYLLAVLLGV